MSILLKGVEMICLKAIMCCLLQGESGCRHFQDGGAGVHFDRSPKPRGSPYREEKTPKTDIGFDF